MTALRHTSQAQAWVTASFGHDADTLPGELSALGQHLGQCQHQHGVLFRLHCLAEAMHGQLASRTVTTLVGVALLFAIAAVAA